MNVKAYVEQILKAIATTTGKSMEEVRREFEAYKSKFPLQLKEETLAIIFAKKYKITIPVKTQLLTEKVTPISELKPGMVATIEGVLLWRHENPKFGNLHFVVADTTGAIYGKASQRFAESLKNIPLNATVRIKGEVKPYAEAEEESAPFIHVYGINASVSLSPKAISVDAVYQKMPNLRRIPGDVVTAIAVPIEATKFSYVRCKSCRNKINPEEYDSADQCPVCGASEGYEEVELVEVTLALEGDIMITAVASSDALIGDMTLFENPEPVRVVMRFESRFQRYRILRVEPYEVREESKEEGPSAPTPTEATEVETTEAAQVKAQTSTSETVASAKKERKEKPSVKTGKQTLMSFTSTTTKSTAKDKEASGKSKTEKAATAKTEVSKPRAEVKKVATSTTASNSIDMNRLKARCIKLLKAIAKPVAREELKEMLMEIAHLDDAVADKVIDALISEGKVLINAENKLQLVE